jgi:hypothetical protein
LEHDKSCGSSIVIDPRCKRLSTDAKRHVQGTKVLRFSEHDVDDLGMHFLYLVHAQQYLFIRRHVASRFDIALFKVELVDI